MKARIQLLAIPFGLLMMLSVATAQEPAAEQGNAETFVLQGHPAFTPGQAELVYRPLVDYLNDVTPYRFDLVISRNFHRYWLDIQRGSNPDLVLEEAHITAYRIVNSDYQPLVRAAQPMTYSLLAGAHMFDAELSDFIGLPLSSMPAPSLGYMILAQWFDNPMQQPLIQSNAASWLDSIEMIFSMEVEAAIAPRNLVERYPNLEAVRTSQEFPGITLSASPAVPSHVQEEIRQALLVLHENEDYFDAVHELDIDRFVEADPIEYEGLDNWLEGAARFY